jgi:phospholipase A1
MNHRLSHSSLALLAALGAVPALAAGTPSTCAAIADNTERLACYDDAVGRPHQEAPAPPPPDNTPFSARWELDAEDKRGTFLIKPYRPTYILLGRITNSANRLPSSPGPDRSVTEPLDVSPVEAKYQISFKTKLWEGLFGRHGDLWMGYTQQSSWQVYNKSSSSPFRETNYEPELMAVFRTNLDAGAGFKVKLLSVGFNHQSNGRAEPLSRSWNRLTAQVGIERGDFALVLAPLVSLSREGRQGRQPGHRPLPGLRRRAGHVEAGRSRPRPDPARAPVAERGPGLGPGGLELPHPPQPEGLRPGFQWIR